ncbi:MAG: 23S rRNA (pseudouridine(1915)-N(3))-methyltransferase RlmH [Pseudomonadota bacterium]|nr:23S rRNA (pseudouridine(1915)-N(3))-methyltransferase RlmH [Pseudomonadota bacterium]
MRITVAAVGQRMPDWVKSACDDYVKRMPRDLPVQLIEVKPGARAEGRPIERAIEEERDRLKERLPADARLITLDERGSLWTTRELAGCVDSARQEVRDLVFLIGGADGLHAEFKGSGRIQFSLSRLTLPHALARVVLCEQLYRAASLLNNHPYHRD